MLILFFSSLSLALYQMGNEAHILQHEVHRLQFKVSQLSEELKHEEERASELEEVFFL